MFYENLPDTLILLREIYLLAQYIPEIAPYLPADPRKQVEATTWETGEGSVCPWQIPVNKWIPPPPIGQPNITPLDAVVNGQALR